MGRPRKEYMWGQQLNDYGVIFLEELEGRKLPSGAIERRIKAKCPVCGDSFETDLRRVTRKDTANKKTVRQCQKCMQEENDNRISKLGKQSIKDLKGQKFGKLSVIEMTDKRQNRGVIWKCKCDCGNIIEVNAVDLQRGHTKSCGCLKSSGEFLIGQVLQSLNKEYVSQKTFEDCSNPEKTANLKFDFYLPDYNCCIEYDGEQHFKPVEFFGGKEKFNRQKLLDKEKERYCQNNNIKLIRIPYTDYDFLDKDYILNLL